MNMRVSNKYKTLSKFLVAVLLLQLEQEYFYVDTRRVHKACKKNSRGRLHTKDVCEFDRVQTGNRSQRNMFPLGYALFSFYYRILAFDIICTDIAMDI